MRSRRLRLLGERGGRLGEAECERRGGEGDVELAPVDLQVDREGTRQLGRNGTIGLSLPHLDSAQFRQQSKTLRLELVRPFNDARRRRELTPSSREIEGLELQQARLDVHQSGRLDRPNVNLDRSLNHQALIQDHRPQPVRFFANRADTRADFGGSPSTDRLKGPLPTAGPVFGSNPEIDREIVLRLWGGLWCANNKEEQKQHRRRRVVCSLECGQDRGTVRRTPLSPDSISRCVAGEDKITRQTSSSCANEPVGKSSPCERRVT